MRSIARPKYRKATGIGVIDNIIGDKGVKTDVSVKIPFTTVPILVVSIIIAVAAGILIAGAAKKAMSK